MDEPWSGTITKEALHIAAEGAKGGQAEMQRVERKNPNPTLGQKPPAGAVVLLPFEEGKLTNLDQWTNKEWTLEPDGSIQVHRGDNRTIKEFAVSSCIWSSMFRSCLPRGRGRGQSGVYLHGRYKIQILDSFGEPLTTDTCGAIYGWRVRKVDASLPPGHWQAYDIDFKRRSSTRSAACRSASQWSRCG